MNCCKKKRVYRLDIGLMLIINRLLERKIEKPDWKIRITIGKKKFKKNKNKVILRLRSLIKAFIVYLSDYKTDLTYLKNVMFIPSGLCSYRDILSWYF